MGERLNIEIIKNGKILANAYYHWSAYTSSAIELTESIMHYINEHDPANETNDLLYAVALLEHTGATLTHEETKIINTQFGENTKKPAPIVNRSNGLIAVSVAGINETRQLENSRVEIHLDTKTIAFDVFYVDDKKSYLDMYNKTEEEYKALPKLTLNAAAPIPFSEFYRLRQHLNNDEQHLIDSNGDVISFIK